eukprot:TRINITY_DN1152_c0_g1_i6.p1 TRINITY_DN1152_c0_g1~~TRINITY_DN1152_c0_g1_i6.p1  ORF type:complete len:1153 (-),score=174.92 TRINITY_DN1152_c0_g1_i6:77-3535(-)
MTQQQQQQRDEAAEEFGAPQAVGGLTSLLTSHSSAPSTSLLLRPHSPAPMGVVALSPSHDAPLLKSDGMRRTLGQTPIGSPAASHSVHVHTQRMASSWSSSPGAAAPSPVGYMAGAPPTPPHQHPHPIHPQQQQHPVAGRSQSISYQQQQQQRGYSASVRSASVGQQPLTPSIGYPSSATYMSVRQQSSTAASTAAGGVQYQSGVFDFDALDEGWLHQSPVFGTHAVPQQSAGSGAAPSIFSNFASEESNNAMPAVSSSFPDQYLLRSGVFPTAVGYSGAQHTASRAAASMNGNVNPGTGLGANFPSSNSVGSNWPQHPAQYGSVPHHSQHDAHHQSAFLTSGPLHAAHMADSPGLPSFAASSLPHSADVLMRRRAMSMGANSAPMTSPAFNVPTAAQSSAFMSSVGVNANGGLANANVNPMASAVAAAAGGAISTKHSSRVIAVINLDSLHEVGVDLQALYDIFQHFGAVRSLDTVAATPESSASGQSPLNISFLPIQRGSAVQNAIALVSFYDLRHSQKAMAALNGKLLPAQSPRGGEPLSLQLQYFVLRDFPGSSSGAPNHQQLSYQPAVQTPFNQYQNQGTLVIFNLDPSVTNEELRDIFSHFGEVKEIRESPNKKHKFVEFFDVRCAEKAMRSLNKTDIKGRKIKIEPSRPGGTQNRKSPPIAVPVAGSLSSVPSSAIVSPSSYDAVPPFKLPLSADVADSLDDTPFPDPSLIQSLSDLVLLHQQVVAEDRLSIDTLDVPSPSSTAGLGSSPLLLSSHLYPPLDNSTDLVRDAPGGETEPHDPAEKLIPTLRLPLPSLPEEPETEKSVPVVVVNKPLAAARRSQRSSSMPPKFNPVLHAATPSPMVVTPTPSVSSSSTISVSKGRKRSSSQSVPSSDPSSPQNMSATNSAVGSPGSSVSSSPVSSPGNSARGPGKSTHSPGSASHIRHLQNRVAKVSGFIRRERSCSEGSQRLAAHRVTSEEDRAAASTSKAAFELDLSRVRNGEDVRTTLMIKNIPNKYDQEMLLLAINRQHVGLYDFFYLPIDFKNKCNVGYAFINFIDPKSICSFFEEFNNKKWERFNSEKVCQITYARIQGKHSMVEHFKNSSLMFEDAKCRPLLFYSDGELAGTAEPFPSPTGRPRPNRRESVESLSDAPMPEEPISSTPSS